MAHHPARFKDARKFAIFVIAASELRSSSQGRSNLSGGEEGVDVL
jgi:hypothetical protein